jgi:hypothetical protein
VFEIGQLVYVKSVSDRVYLGMVMKNILYLNNFEEAFYEIYLIGSGDRVSVPAAFIIPVPKDEVAGLKASDPKIPYWPDTD